MKKIIGIFVAVFLLISASVPASIVFAASLSDSIILQLTETHTDSQIDINVKLVTNTGISAMTLELVYNKNIFEYNGYEKGTALNDLDLMSTNLSTNPSLPVKFNWFNQNPENDFSTGNLLKLHFALKSDIPNQEYEIGFKYNDGDITYIDKNNPNSKSAIISKAVINITENKITETEIVETPTENNNTAKLLLIIGSVVLTISVVAAIVLIIKIKKKKRGRKNWLKI